MSVSTREDPFQTDSIRTKCMISATFFIRRALFPTAVAALLGGSGVADARVARLEIIRVESPAFEGRSFGEVGQYE